MARLGFEPTINQSTALKIGPRNSSENRGSKSDNETLKKNSI